MASLLALLSSVLWGTADFVGGYLTKKHKAAIVTAASQVFGLAMGIILLISDRKSTRLNSSHSQQSRMPSSA